MPKKPLFASFIFILFATTCWYSSQAVWKLYFYTQIDHVFVTKDISWEIHQTRSDRFLLNGSYRFTFKGKEYSGSTLLKHPIFRNHWSAKEALPKIQSRSWQVWYNAKKPEQSSLERSYPLKELISAATLLILLLYFIGISIYVTWYNKGD